MNSAERREKIIELLKDSKQPVSAGSIAEKFHVSRQVIVNDIALLRAASKEIAATPRGYVLEKPGGTPGGTYTIACCHQNDLLPEELYTVVDNGGGLIDVIVEHPLYGQISGQLHIFSRYDVDCFLQKVKDYEAVPLSGLTGGVHLHTISCPNEEVFSRITASLREKKILLETENT